jgi:hypothetical protein
MRRHVLLAAIGLAAIILTGCGSYTRTERDIYTITQMDTVVTDRVRNQPGDRDNGIIYPSTRTVTLERTMVQRDSLVERHYPAFIRLGVFEGIGTIGSAIDGAKSTYTGLFGVFYDIDQLLNSMSPDTTESATFSGYIYRIGIGEWRLPWFGDATDWTWGVTAIEYLQPDNRSEHRLTGAGVLTINKRFYLSDKIPYLAIRPSVSLSMLPSQYVNASVSADAGSIGGVNLRLYAGYAFGANLFQSPVRFVNFPYVGVGASVLDFLNREEELDVEWIHHEHSAWEIGALDFAFIGSSADRSFFVPQQTGTDVPTMKGMVGRAGFATLALPVLDRRLSLGTALVNIALLGAEEYGVSFFPLRLSYHITPFTNNAILEPFAEYNFAPSTFTHLGMRFTVPIGEQMSVQLVGGWISGTSGSAYDSGQRFIGEQDFQTIYLGIGASLFERLFGRDELRYGKGYPHE